MYDLLAEVVPSACEAFLAQVVRATPDQLREYGDSFVIIPIPNKLVEESAPVDLDAVKKKMCATFRPYLKTVEWYEDGEILDEDENVVFNLAMQDMRALRFIFRIPPHLLMDNE